MVIAYSTRYIFLPLLKRVRGGGLALHAPLADGLACWCCERAPVSTASSVAPVWFRTYGCIIIAHPPSTDRKGAAVPLLTRQLCAALIFR